MIKGLKLASSKSVGKIWLDVGIDRIDTWTTWVELFNQIADRFRTLWPIVSAMQTRDSLLRSSHCALAISVLIVVINEWIRDLEFYIRTAAGNVQSWTWSHVVNTSELQWIGMLKHLTELNDFITLLPMRKMLIMKYTLFWSSWTFFVISWSSFDLVLVTTFETLCHTYRVILRLELFHWPPCNSSNS